MPKKHQSNSKRRRSDYMDCNSKPFTQIDREYKITSAELRKALGLKGEILDMSLYCGRSPNDDAQGKSPEKDVWVIHTEEIRKGG